MTQPTDALRKRKADRLAVKIVSIVAEKVSSTGELYAYEGIEAAREIKALLLKAYP